MLAILEFVSSPCTLSLDYLASPASERLPGILLAAAILRHLTVSILTGLHRLPRMKPRSTSDDSLRPINDEGDLRSCSSIALKYHLVLDHVPLPVYPMPSTPCLDGLDLERISIVTGTDSTVSNQPGLGRTLDHAYTKLLRLFGVLHASPRLAIRVDTETATKFDPVDATAPSRAYLQVIYGVDPDKFSVLTGTDSTASGRAGVGRTFDGLLSKGARKLEAAITASAQRLGFGPNAVMARIVSPREVHVVCCGSEQCVMVHTDIRPCSYARLQPRDILDYLYQFKCTTCREAHCKRLLAYAFVGRWCQKLVDIISGDNGNARLLALYYTSILCCLHEGFRGHFVSLDLRPILDRVAGHIALWDLEKRAMLLRAIRQSGIALSLDLQKSFPAAHKNNKNGSTVWASLLNPDMRTALAFHLTLCGPHALRAFTGDAPPSPWDVHAFWQHLLFTANPIDSAVLWRFLLLLYDCFANAFFPHDACDRLWLPMFRACVRFPERLHRLPTNLFEGLARLLFREETSDDYLSQAEFPSCAEVGESVAQLESLEDEVLALEPWTGVAHVRRMYLRTTHAVDNFYRFISKMEGVSDRPEDRVHETSSLQENIWIPTKNLVVLTAPPKPPPSSMWPWS